MKGTRWNRNLAALGVFLMLALVCPTASLQATAPVRGLYLIDQPLPFDPSCTEIPVACVVVDFSGADKAPAVSNARARVGVSQVEAEGKWSVIDGRALNLDKEAFDHGWALLQAPGVKRANEAESVRNLQSALDGAKNRGDVIVLNVPTPPDAKMGDVYELAVDVSLETGETLTAVGIATTQELRAPTGWVAGDAHMHTDVGSDGWGMVYTVPKAESLGHDFMYLTDHADLLSAGIGWDTYCDVARNWSASYDLTILPGIEVTCADDDGDCLGFGLPADDDSALTTIVNWSEGCADTVDSIQSFPGATACVAHPDGPGVEWAYYGTGYDGVQVVDGPGSSFWTTQSGGCIRTTYWPTRVTKVTSIFRRRLRQESPHTTW